MHQKKNRFLSTQWATNCDLTSSKLVKQGINPVIHREQEKARLALEAGNTFEVIVKEWLALKGWEAITKKRRLNMLERGRLIQIDDRKEARLYCDEK